MFFPRARIVYAWPRIKGPSSNISLMSAIVIIEVQGEAHRLNSRRIGPLALRTKREPLLRLLLAPGC
ncbi:hypothetical protein M0R45_027549 [Rubus argutus]|uniref:Uncharacterized protein n=1 Tax=Rubus argutus TaxID=59490 RepID=A0AAW1X472_RUBAR